MNWQCTICENKWLATFDHIRNSCSGCPNCSCYKSERLCRHYFQTLLGYNFQTKRPNFLKGLEYDGWSKEIKLAFEYQGILHYEYVEYFHKTEDKFRKLQERDKLKVKLSKENNIILITVPYRYSYKNPDEMEKYITNRLIEEKIIK